MDWNTYYEEKLQVIRDYKHDFRTDDPCLILGWLVDFFPDDLEFIEENAFHLFAKAGGEENDQSIIFLSVSLFSHCLSSSFNSK